MAVGGLEKYLSLPADEDEIMESAGLLSPEGAKISPEESGVEVAYVDRQYPAVPPSRRLRVMTAETKGENTPDSAVIVGGKGGRGGGKGQGGNGIGDSESGSGSEGEGDLNIRLLSNASYRSFAVHDGGGTVFGVRSIQGRRNVRGWPRRFRES